MCFEPKKTKQKKHTDVCFLCFEVDVMYSTVTWEALKTKKGNESLLGICRKLSAVTKSGVTRGSGPGEQNGERLFMGCLKDCSRLTGQLKFNTSGSLCQQACHLDQLYGCSGVCGVHSSQQDVIKGTAAKSKPTIRTVGRRCPCPACSSLWQQRIKQKGATCAPLWSLDHRVLLESPWHRLVIESTGVLMSGTFAPSY